MPRFVKIVIAMAIVASGLTLTYWGAHYWSTTQRTVPTKFDTAASGDGEGQRIDNSDPWFDKEFVTERAAAALVVFLGLSLVFCAPALLRERRRHGSAT